MVLSDKFNKSSFFKNLLFSSVFLFSGCGGDDPKPTSPSSDEGNGKGYEESSGKTNNDGELELKVGDQEFDVFVSNNGENSLEGIDINGVDFGNGIYGFLAKDFNGDYFTDVVYVNLNSVSSIDNFDAFRINHIMNEIRGRDYDKEIHEENEPYIFSLSSNDRLEFLGTIASDDLSDFYKDNDAITKNIDILEFSANVTNRPELTFAVEAGKFRRVFIENLNNMNDVVNDVASFLGGSFEKEAYYIDVYKNDLGVLAHESSQKGFSTIKGNVNDSYGRGLDGASVRILDGPVVSSVFTDNDGLYFLKYLKNGDYEIRASHFGFDSKERSKGIIQSSYMYPECKELNFFLDREREETLDTLVLQPGPNEGKDVFVSTIWGGEYVNHGDEVWLNVSCANNNVDIARVYIQFDISSIPRSSNIESAIFSIYGQESTREGNFVVAAKRVKEAWNESNANWHNKSDFDSYIYDEATPRYRNQNDPVNFDLTRLTQEWINRTYNNYGFVLMLKEETGNKIGFFTSSDLEELGAERRPKLTITYRN